MRITFLTLLCVSIVLVTPRATPAGTPHVGIYFDPEYTQVTADCHGYEMGYLYVVAEDFNVYVAGVEFSVEYPAEILWLSDMEVPPVTIGNTPTGISMAWPLPQNGFSPILLTKVMILWNCSYCTRGDVPVCVKANPYSGYLRATRYPDYAFVYATVQAAVLCPMCSGPMCAGTAGACPDPPQPPVPIEDMSWGKIKELYR